MPQGTLNKKQAKHDWGVQKAVEMILAFLKRQNISATIDKATRRTLSYDFKINGVRVSVRVGSPNSTKHFVTVAGRKYEYSYPNYSFNLHSHGKPIDTDIVVLICAKKTGSSFRVTRFFAFPRKAHTSPTFSYHISKSGNYKGKLRPYMDSWDVLLSLAEIETDTALDSSA